MSLTIQPNCTDNPEFGTIPVNTALDMILEAIHPSSNLETIPVQDCYGRVLAEDIHSTIMVPPFTNSAMDGYAIHHQDIPAAAEQLSKLTIIGTTVAGQAFQGKVNQGETVRIMTGAVMPEGTDSVIIQEHVETKNDTITIDSRHQSGQNVRQAGEDIKPGDCVLNKGRQCLPADAGIIASLGIPEIKVFSPLRVAVFSTGSEVCDFSQKATDSSQTTTIFDSNRYSLCAALKPYPVDIVDMGIIPDNPQHLKTAFLEASQNAELIITSGGVSVGEADYTKQVLAELGQIEFWTVAMKPGRPIAFGKINSALLFGLPGNPVAVMVTWCFLLKPALEKMLGITNAPVIPSFQARSLSHIRKRPGRTEYQRGILKPDGHGQWSVETTGKQGSGILTSMCKANAFIVLEHDHGSVKPGDMVNVQPFSGIF
ncbi:MAG: molybdopterin molybdotransferase MoeA [Gammaproteobacteria bacterium]|nr:molybdopterin molybdotransferase MoeA [Gammaproteobacteria bacterium]